ncbi:hypothetical protein B0A66_22275 [Flavobacterium hercynium]|uniref:Uncharacterized protein n=1 Tax=Flavobacterium hercynium TaxID=387094 RepID=A0A226GNB0_9FLAO|nr:hypothetical protein B0A66_22275 [Flavobacterium hercynium]
MKSKKIELINKSLYKLIFMEMINLFPYKRKKTVTRICFESINKEEYSFTKIVVFHKNKREKS